MTKTITSFPVSWHSAFLQSTLIAEQPKLETVKTTSALSKINAISLNVKISKLKSVHLRGYKLPIYVQNFMQKDSAQAKISSKVVGGATFLTHPVYQQYSLEWNDYCQTVQELIKQEQQRVAVVDPEMCISFLFTRCRPTHPRFCARRPRTVWALLYPLPLLLQRCCRYFLLFLQKYKHEVMH